MSLKRGYSYSTTQEDYSQSQEMPKYASKRRRVGAKKSTRSITRAPLYRSPGAGGNKCIIPLTVDYDFNLSADPRFGLAFDQTAMYVNGIAYNIPGATELMAVFGMSRLVKVELTLLPAATGLDLNNQTLSSGVTNIPFIYEAIDYEDGSAPTEPEIRQNATVKIHLFNRVIRRTIYPRLEGNSGVIDVGTNVSNIFKKTDSSSSQKWHGWKVWVDMLQVGWTYGSGRVAAKCYFECMQSK